jgi:CheY-like chemotaxis protein
MADAGLRVLLVDDNVGLSAIAIDALEAAGCAVAHAVEGDRAAVLARAHGAQVIFVALDLSDAVDHLAGRTATGSARIIGLADQASRGVRARARALALDGLVVRPHDPSALGQALIDAL